MSETNDSLRFFRHPDYMMMQWLWKKMRLLLSGSETVKWWDIAHTEGKPRMETFLLRPVGEEDEQYARYVYSARYSNFVGRSKDILEGLLFYRDPTYTLPAAMQPFVTNIDMEGTHLVEFVKRIAGEILTVNRGGVYVDYPMIEGPQTVAQAEQLNARPFAKFAPAERVFNWQYTVINNVRTLTRVDIAEETDEDFDAMNWHLVRSLTLEQNPDTGAWEYWNTLYNVTWTREFGRSQGILGGIKHLVTYAQLAHSAPQDSQSGYLGQAAMRARPTDYNGKPFSSIPFWFTSLVYDQQHVDKAVLNDVADANIAHYRLCADIQSALFHCGHPTPIFCGFTFDKKERVVLGSMQGISTPDASARASYLELTGQSIAELRAERDATVKDMAALGARSLSMASANSQTSAETSQLNATGDTAVLNTLAGTLNTIVRSVLHVMAEFQGVADQRISFDMSREFMPMRLASNEIAVLLNAVLQKAMSIEDFIAILQSGGIVNQSITNEDYIARLKNPAVVVGADKGTAPSGNPAAIPQAGIGEGSTKTT